MFSLPAYLFRGELDSALRHRDDYAADQNPYRGSGQEYLADAWEDSWLDTVATD